jgi:short-subunit dehydrogenase
VHSPQEKWRKGFAERYGPWAVVAGGSSGLGAAFATALAGLGLSLLLISRSEKSLTELRDELQGRFAVTVRTLCHDLAQEDTLSALKLATGDLDIGLLVYNAAFSNIGPFLESTLENHKRVINVNVRGPALCVHHLGRLMEQKGRGGIILMSSLTALQGTPYIAHYGATKAYNLMLAEGLWYELRERGIDVVACCAGPTDTPAFRESLPKDREFPRFPPVLKPERVVAVVLKALGKRGSVISGALNRLSAFFMTRFLSRRAAVTVMGNTVRTIYL